MEDTYRREKLTADEIYRRRNSKETTEVIEKIRTELYDLLANPDESRSKLMSKALNYLKNHGIRSLPTEMTENTP